MDTEKINSDSTDHVLATHSVSRPRRSAVSSVRLRAAVAAVGVAGVAAAAGLIFSGALSTAPSFPDAATTGVPVGTILRTVPGQVSSGPGWEFDASTGSVEVTGDNAVLSDLYIPYNLDIKDVSNVTIDDDQVVTGGNFGVSLRHTANVTVENSTVSGQNSTTGRVDYAITDIYSDSTGIVIKNDNISDWRIGVYVTSGQVTSNYIHDPGFIAGDHTDGIFDNGGSRQLTISGNTILNSLGETDAIFLYVASGLTTSNKTITDNLLAGGSYPLYGGGTSNIRVENNRFSQQYYPKSGQYGPVAYYDPHGKGNVWSGNVWDSTGQAVAP